MKLYRVHTTVKKFHGCLNVPFDWFGCDRREPRPYAELIEDYSPGDLDQEVAIDELFTATEAIALKAYLDREHDGAGVTTIEEVPLPIPHGSIGTGAIPVGGCTNFHMLDKEPNYSLPFKAWAYFDLRGCEPHRSPTKRRRSLSETTVLSAGGAAGAHPGAAPDNNVQPVKRKDVDKPALVYRDKDGVIRHEPIELPEFLSGIIAAKLTRPLRGTNSAEGENGKYLEVCRIDVSYVHLPEGMVEHDDHNALENALSEAVNDAISRLPWTRDQFTKAEFQEWLATRKTAGAAIDIATCELGRWAAYDLDPYDADPDLPEEMQQIGTNRWVRSPESRGWVWEGDLPPAKFKAMYDRIIDKARARAAAAGKKWEEPDPKITGAIF